MDNYQPRDLDDWVPEHDDEDEYPREEDERW